MVLNVPNTVKWADKMAQWVKGLAVNVSVVSLIPWTHIKVEGEKEFQTQSSHILGSIKV